MRAWKGGFKMDVKQKTMNEVFSDEAFVKSLFEMESAEKAQEALKEKGVELSVEELKEIRQALIEQVDENGELSMDALDSVAGGIIRNIPLPIIGKFPVFLPTQILRW